MRPPLRCIFYISFTDIGPTTWRRAPLSSSEGPEIPVQFRGGTLSMFDIAMSLNRSSSGITKLFIVVTPDSSFVSV